MSKKKKSKKNSTKKSTKETPTVQIDFEKCVEDPKVELREPETWTIITALNWILNGQKIPNFSTIFGNSSGIPWLF